jgi:pimeloyl-ACP methyl ester carboxylesterase
VRVLNRGGRANPDVLIVERSPGDRVIVKDYGRRSWLVRRFLAPLLVGHELRMLERLDGLPGVPAALGRVDSLALALELMPGEALRRSAHRKALPPAFFTALEGILAGLAERGVLHLDLASPTNVLLNPTGGPALVDLGGALAFPVPRRLRAWLEGRALAKLRSRFQGEGTAPVPERGSDFAQLDLGPARLRLRDRGPLSDPVPVLLLPDAGLSGARFGPLLDGAVAARRRLVAVDPPGFGRSRAPGGDLSPERVADLLLRLLDVMRVEEADVIGEGWGGFVARALDRVAPERVRKLVLIDAPSGPLEGAQLARWELAQRDPDTALELLAAEPRPELDEHAQRRVARDLERVDPADLRRVYASLPREIAPLPPGRRPAHELDSRALAQVERIWAALS